MPADAANGGAATISGWPVAGHDEAVAGLRRALATDKVSHAYLFAGPHGVGKRALAVAFAQALCCTAAERADPTIPCRTCLACRKIARGVHPDVQTFGLAAQAALADKGGGRNTALTIDTVRLLCASSALRPMEAPRRVVIVDDAATMHEVAQEAFLKTLEEPPPAVVLILLADEAETLLPTIRSRCQVLELRPADRTVVVAALVAADVERERATEIAVLARGRVGWAMRAASDPTLLQTHRDGIDRALGWIGGSVYDRLVTAVRLGDTFQKRRSAVFEELESLLCLWRDALLLRAGLPEWVGDGAAIDRLDSLTRGWDLEAISRSVRAVQVCIADLDANVRPRLAMEVMVLQWPTHSRLP